MTVFQHSWTTQPTLADKAKNLTAKFKYTRKILKDWQRSLPNIDKTVSSLTLLRNIAIFQLKNGISGSFFNPKMLNCSTFRKSIGNNGLPSIGSPKGIFALDFFMLTQR
jgi:hypothetical protein